MCELSLCLSFRRRRQTFAKIAKILVRANHTHQMLKLRRYVCNVMCRVINAIQCQVWFSSLKLKGYHVVASCTFSCTFFVQSKSTQCHVSLLCTRQRTAVNKSLSIMAVGGRNISVKHFLCSKARVQRCFRWLFEALARFLLCLFSRIMSLRVFSETSLGKRVNLVLSDFNHLLDLGSRGFKVWFFFEVSCWCRGGRLEDAREGESANGVKCDNHWNLFPRFPEFCSHSLRRTSELDSISLECLMRARNWKSC